MQASNKQNALIKRISKEVVGKLLHHAFMISKCEGIVLNVHSLNGVELLRHKDFYEKNDFRINVIVVNSTVKKSWIG